MVEGRVFSGESIVIVMTDGINKKASCRMANLEKCSSAQFLIFLIKRVALYFEIEIIFFTSPRNSKKRVAL